MRVTGPKGCQIIGYDMLYEATSEGKRSLHGHVVSELLDSSLFAGQSIFALDGLLYMPHQGSDLSVPVNQHLSRIVIAPSASLGTTMLLR